MLLDEKWEIDREYIILLGFFGEGVFGKVMKVEVIGLFNMFSYRFEVVVKMLKGKICLYFLCFIIFDEDFFLDVGLMKKDIFFRCWFNKKSSENIL